MQANTNMFVSSDFGRQTIDGMSLVGMRYRLIEPDTTYEFWFDPLRGCLPVRATMTMSENQLKRMYILDARDCGGGRWYPTRVLLVFDHIGDPSVTLSEMLVLELHPGGANFLFADGSVHFLEYGLGANLAILATRNKGDGPITFE